MGRGLSSRRGSKPSRGKECTDCGHHKKLHHGGICGDRFCKQWMKNADGRCPSMAHQDGDLSDN